MPTREQAIEKLYDLNLGIVGTGNERHERPHKPLLLLAVLDLIDAGLATPDRIPWCQALRDRFTARFDFVRKRDDQNTPENPFHYLKTDGFWKVWREDQAQHLPVEAPPTVGQMGSVFARFTDGFESLVADPNTRALLRAALISRYFPHLSEIRDPQSEILNPPSDLRAADEPAEFGRSPAFRRLILDIYDHQCAACGLRIRLPAGNDVSFIDAAHLLPWDRFHNDHPTNGLALCKNHHWAMDRDIIAPGPDLHWHVTKAIDPRRSNGEKELADLSGKSLLLPNDPAFHPDLEGLEWRHSRVCA